MLRPSVRRLSYLLALAAAPVLGAGFAASTVTVADAAPPAKDLR